MLKVSEATVDRNSQIIILHGTEPRPIIQRLFWREENTTKSSLVLSQCNHIRWKRAVYVPCVTFKILISQVLHMYTAQLSFPTQRALICFPVEMNICTTAASSQWVI